MNGSSPPDWPAADRAYQLVLGVGLAGRTTWPSRRTGAGLADVIRRLGSWAVLELHLPELGIRSKRRRAGC